jgi:hypothetical protein
VVFFNSDFHRRAFLDALPGLAGRFNDHREPELIEAMHCGCVPILPRRLSYPEILPPEHQAACLYDGPEELVAKLCAAITDLPALKARDFRAVAAQHDWRFAAPRFDAALEQITRHQH